ncbi:geranylgeranyl diphosphate synthase, type II [Desulfotomaculum arcticum]|uniref:Farnesyl diphosphate synthase n=1 Tax=Desulfotruncus arcticus DSM 17038 TaxID=1121424 RepID=A0A1I2MQG7_9FIRM|nr:farnesyl diphosphate synthase [Desulfotruncus arcticus]SFF93702.1 geranylgeranyl diphosphate synthase, type II [Desulfotomaculum arcticum] [Desulfotruncus arcticus DSM 17038]
MDFKTELARRALVIDQALNHCLPAADAHPSIIHEAIRYSIFAGGKRLRPALVMASACAVDGDESLVLPAACAVEVLHTYSLVHDDLPAMDNDDLRRGKPTSHKKFGEAIAILAGDSMLTMAFALLAGMGATGRVMPDKVVQVISEVALAAGTCGLIGGQVVDLLSSEKEIAQQELEYIHTHKTGALYRASVRAGAILSGASPDQIAKLTAYADNLGLAFQITDDILDIEGDEEKLGKPVGSDNINKKATYPALYGLEESRKLARAAGDRALAALNPFGAEAEFLRLLVQFVLSRDN